MTIKETNTTAGADENGLIFNAARQIYRMMDLADEVRPADVQADIQRHIRAFRGASTADDLANAWASVVGMTRRLQAGRPALRPVDGCRTAKEQTT